MVGFCVKLFLLFSSRAFNVGSYLARFCLLVIPIPFAVEWGVLYRCFGGCQGGFGGFLLFLF